MVSGVRRDGAPEDYDPTGYYRRKAEHREEMIPALAWLYVAGLAMILFATAVNFYDSHKETLMFGLDLTTLITGILIGLVLVQLYPPSARIGLFIINRGKAALEWIRNR